MRGKKHKVFTPRGTRKFSNQAGDALAQEVTPQPQPFGTILSNIPQQGREQLGALGDFDDGIGHDGCAM